MAKVTVLIALICILSAQIVYAEDDTACVEILTVSGQAEISRKAQDFVLAEEGAILEAGDRIRTKKGSFVEISFDPDDKNVSKIGENSLVVLVFKDNEKLELMDGDIFSTLSGLPKDSSFEIRTPTAVAGVRGTDWRIEATSEATVVESLDSNAFVRNINPDGSLSSEETLIPPGFTTDVKKFERPQAVRRMSEKRMQKMIVMKADVINRAVETRKFRKPSARMLRQKRPLGPNGSSGPGGPGGPSGPGDSSGSGDARGQVGSGRPGDRKMGLQDSRNVQGSTPAEPLHKDVPTNNKNKAARPASQNIHEPQRGMAKPMGNPVGTKPKQRSNPPAGKRP